MIQGRGEIVFTFRASRAAINGERHLSAAGLRVKAMALPSALGAGCGLCLRFDEPELERARELLKTANIEPEGIYYRLTEKGRSVYKSILLNGESIYK